MRIGSGSRSAFTTVCLGALLCVMIRSGPVCGQEQVKVGFLTREAPQHRADWRDHGYRGTLVENGMDGSLVENRAMMTGGLDEEAFYTSLKPFNVIAVASTTEGVYSLTEELKGTCRGARAALERFVSEGGGLFVLLQAERYPNSEDEHYFNLLLEGFGCRFIHEGVYDPEHTFMSPATLTIPSWEYFHTTNITPHPVTAQVRRLYLPKLQGNRPGVPAFELEDPWTTVVAGEQTARSFVQNPLDNAFDTTQSGSYDSAPPVAAVRDFGKGRVFVYAAPDRHVFGNFGNRLWPHITETDGDAEHGKPSDGNRLVINALQWLGQPSLNIPGFGTYGDVPPEPVDFPASVSWDKYEFAPIAPGADPDRYPDGVPMDFPEAAVGIKGVIGAHTSLSDGEGTVADYVAAAKAAGLRFIVFAEPLELLEPEELEELKKECAAASEDPDFVACPGVEYTDVLGNRWVAWGSKVIYPPATFEYRDRSYTLWDGERIWLTGRYEDLCGHRPNALLDYGSLERAPADRTNMWWFYRLIPFAYDGGEQIADNFGQWLFSLRDLRWMDLASFTRMRSPSEVPQAAQTCVTVLRNVAQARKWLDSRCSTYNHAAKPYVTQGPLILFWEGINTQMELPVAETRGCQRVRMKFDVASDNGIREVKVHDADFGVVRRFLGHGAERLTRQFELVHGQQHFLTLEVIDTQGLRAISRYIFVFCYKSGLYRCGDNLNTLSSMAMTWHPDRDELCLAKHIEDIGRVSVAGFDTSSGVAPQPSIWSWDGVNIPSAKGFYPTREDGNVNKILQVGLTSHDIQKYTVDMKYLTQGYDSEERPGPALCSVPRRLGENEYFERTHTSHVLRSRVDYYVKWNYRRVFEGTKDYRGGIVWHEGHLRFKKDVTLNGTVPVPLIVMNGPGGAPYRQFDHLFVTDLERGTLGIALLPEDKVHTAMSGRIAPGGYLAVMPTDVGYYAFFSSSDGQFVYDSQDWDKKVAKFGWVWIGLGQDGQQIKAGTVLPYRFMVASLNDRRVSNELLEDMRRAYNLDGGTEGYPLEVKRGSLVDAELFLTLKADAGEVVLDVGPKEMVVDLPIRVQGLDDNGCVAVYSSVSGFFRFIAVDGDTAYCQEPIEKKAALWVGNVFKADDRRMKLALVRLGQDPGKKPFLEVHNPTDEAIRTVISSPPNTPLFGGFRRDVEVPAGDSIRIGDLEKE